MIRVEPIKFIPNWHWNATSEKEYALMPKEAHQHLIRFSRPAVELYHNEVPFFVGGIYSRTLTDMPMLWALFTRDFTRVPTSVFRATAKLFKGFPSRLETLVEEGNLPAQKLARAFGFHPRAEVLAIENTFYRFYRRG